MCLMRDKPQVKLFRFQFLIGNLFGNNVYANRLVCWLLQIIGSLVLAYGLWLNMDIPIGFLKKKDQLVFIFVGRVVLGADVHYAMSFF